MNTVIIYVDGSCPNNGSATKSGAGIWYADHDDRNASITIPGNEHTNQRAELYAIQYALMTNKDSENILIYTDSKYSIDCIYTWIHAWNKNNWKNSKGKDVKNAVYIKSIENELKDRNTKGYVTNIKHVNGHVGVYGNEQADILAKKACT